MLDNTDCKHDWKFRVIGMQVMNYGNKEYSDSEWKKHVDQKNMTAVRNKHHLKDAVLVCDKCTQSKDFYNGG